MTTKNTLIEEIAELFKSEQYKAILDKIDPETLKILMDKGKEHQVFVSIMKMLKEREPENATKEYAEKIIDLMKKVATSLGKSQ